MQAEISTGEAGGGLDGEVGISKVLATTQPIIVVGVLTAFYLITINVASGIRWAAMPTMALVSMCSA